MEYILKREAARLANRLDNVRELTLFVQSVGKETRMYQDLAYVTGILLLSERNIIFTLG